MSTRYETFEILWRGVPIQVSHAPWFANYRHIELRSESRLPVTETGYRSHFIHETELALFDSVEVFVNEWLDTAAFEQGGLQLSLF